MRFGFGALVFSHGEQRSALKQMPKTKQQQQQFTHTHKTGAVKVIYGSLTWNCKCRTVAKEDPHDDAFDRKDNG